MIERTGWLGSTQTYICNFIKIFRLFMAGLVFVTFGDLKMFI